MLNDARLVSRVWLWQALANMHSTHHCRRRFETLRRRTGTTDKHAIIAPVLFIQLYKTHTNLKE